MGKLHSSKPKPAYAVRRDLEKAIQQGNLDKTNYVYTRRFDENAASKKLLEKGELELCDEKNCLPDDHSASNYFPTYNYTRQGRVQQPQIQCGACMATHKMSSVYYRKYLVQSKFALIIHGDTPTTSRLYDAIANMQIPVFLSPTIYVEGLPFLDKVPWYDFSVFIDPYVSSMEEVAMRLSQLADEEFYPRDLLEHKFERLKKHQKDLLWMMEGSEVVDRVLEDQINTCR